VREAPVTLVLAQSGLVDDRHLEHPPISGLATGRTNITHAWPEPYPHRVCVVTAVEEVGAFEKLLDEFPGASRARFRKVNLVDVRAPLPLTPTPRFVNIPAVVRTRRAHLLANSSDA
jgi:hypothetical protein